MHRTRSDVRSLWELTRNLGQVGAWLLVFAALAVLVVAFVAGEVHHGVYGRDTTAAAEDGEVQR